MKLALSSLLFVLSVTVPAWGRLGETGDELVARYGQPLSELDQKGEGKKIPLVQLVFQKNGFEIDASLSDGTSGEESFRKINGDPLSLLEIRTLLGINAQGYGWEAPQTSQGEEWWTRDDGAVATLTGGRILSIKSKDLINKEVIARKVETTPTLQGF